jgi:thiosulfate/3-mercaptopyruvate sulfurtransferase
LEYTVAPAWVKEHLEDKNVRIIDCRFSLGNPEAGLKEYRESHIPGAVFFDLEKDLSSPAGIHGGRHPLPDIDELTSKLESAGINNETILVAYDAKEGAFSSRFWWVLKYFGHSQVYILDGGYQAWTDSGYPVNDFVMTFDTSEYTPSINHDMVATYQEVKGASLKKDGAVLIDSRERKRYLGIEEPIDRVAGHIPNSINKPWMDVFDNGFCRPLSQQEMRFSEIDKDKEIIVYCGSGITATPNFAALKKAGYRHVKLYAGSYSDWVSYEENPVSQGNEGS